MKTKKKEKDVLTIIKKYFKKNIYNIIISISITMTIINILSYHTRIYSFEIPCIYQGSWNGPVYKSEAEKEEKLKKIKEDKTLFKEIGINSIIISILIIIILLYLLFTKDNKKSKKHNKLAIIIILINIGFILYIYTKPSCNVYINLKEEIWQKEEKKN